MLLTTIQKEILDELEDYGFEYRDIEIDKIELYGRHSKAIGQAMNNGVTKEKFIELFSIDDPNALAEFFKLSLNEQHLGSIEETIQKYQKQNKEPQLQENQTHPLKLQPFKTYFRKETRIASFEQFKEILTSPDGSLPYFMYLHQKTISHNPEQFQKNLHPIIEAAWNDYNEMVELLDLHFFSSQEENHDHLDNTSKNTDFNSSDTFSEEMNNFFMQPLINNNLIPGSLSSQPTKLSISQTMNLPWIKSAGSKESSTLVFYGSPLTINISNTLTNRANNLIKQGADVNKYALEFGTNPLLLSIIKGWNHQRTDFDKSDNQKEIILTLLSHPELDINAPFLGNGMTALHIACLRGDDPELIELLLAKGADPYLEDYSGCIASDYLSTNYEEVKNILSKMTAEQQFGYKNEPNKSYVATVPTEADRKINSASIEKILPVKLAPRL